MNGKYNHLMNSHFSGCMQLAAGYDVHRERDVNIFLLPSNDEYVGVSDGTDSWIAPVVADPLRCNLRQIILDLRTTGKAPVIHKAVPQPTTGAVAPRARKTPTAPVITAPRERKRPATV